MWCKILSSKPIIFASRTKTGSVRLRIWEFYCYLLLNDSKIVCEERGTLWICITERQSEERKEEEQKESHAHHSSLCNVYRAWEIRRDLTFPSFPHQTCSVSLLSPSITISAGPLKLNDRKWGRHLVKEGKQSNGGFMLIGGRKRKVTCHTHASGETEFTVHLPLLRGVSLIQGLFNEIRVWNYG